MKRLVVGLSVSALTLFVVPAASADSAESTSSEVGIAKVKKVKKPKKDVFTDQVVIKTPGGGVSTQRIDWD